MDPRDLMTPSFAGLNGGLFSSVQKADVGDGAGRLIERGVDIMAWADPFFPDPSLPASVEHAMTTALAEGTPSHYSMPVGRADLRQALARRLSRRMGREIDAGRNILVTPGSDAGLLYAMMPFIGPGDEVLVPEPTYPNNLLNPELLGGTTVSVPLSPEDNYQLSIPELETRITDRSKMVLLCHPNNPTTTVYRRETLEALAEVVIRHNLVLVCDQAFEDHVYDDIEFVSPATLDGMWERTVTVGSISKGYGLSGLRIGHICTSDHVMDVLYGAAVNVIGAASTASSIGATAALEDPEILPEIRRRLDARRRLMVEILGSIPGVRMQAPESGILAWLDVSALGRSAEIVDYLLAEANVLVNPGDQYGAHGEGWIRLEFAVFADDRRAEAAFLRIRDALSARAVQKGLT